MADRPVLRAFGDPAVDLAAYVADVAAITGETALAVARSAGRLRPVVRDVLWRQIYFGAVRATPFTLLLALLVAFAVAAQSPYSAAAGGGVLGTVLVATLVRELAPLLAAWIVIARSGTAIAAELATMRIEGDERVGLLAALQGAARLSGVDPAGAAEAADLHRRAAAVADGLGLAEVAARERASAAGR